MNQKTKLFKNLLTIAFSIIIAVLLVETGIIQKILLQTQTSEILGSFFSGLLFTSIFTTAISMAAIGEITQAYSPIYVALIGGLGAMLGDFIIFKLIRKNISAEAEYILKEARQSKIFSFLHLKTLRWLMPIVGSLIIISPLPDELGLAFLGISKIRTKSFLLLSYGLNTVGILIIGLLARNFF